MNHAAVAFGIRSRIRKQKPITRARLEWLIDYEKRFPNAIPDDAKSSLAIVEGEGAPKVTEDAAPTNEPAQEPGRPNGEQAPNPPSISEPPPLPTIDLPPIDVGSASAMPGQGGAGNAPSAAHAPTGSAGAPAPAAPVPLGSGPLGQQAASLYTSFAMGWNQRASEKGMTPLPEPMIALGAQGCAVLAEHYLPKDTDPVTLASIQAVSPVGWVAVQEWKARNEKKGAKVYAMPSPPQGTERVREAPKDVPPPASPPPPTRRDAPKMSGLGFSGSSMFEGE